MAGLSNCELALNKKAPDFEAEAVVNGEFETIKLSQYKGYYIVLFYYPNDFTFVCPTEIIAFADRMKEFTDIKCKLIAASCDSKYCHFQWCSMPRKKGGLGLVEMPIISDCGGHIARKYGVFNEPDGNSYRGLFIIDDKSILRQITINDMPVGRSVDETLRLVQAYQFTDKHGEVCPAGWKPGDATMKADVRKSQEYFKAHG